MGEEEWRRGRRTGRPNPPPRSEAQVGMPPGLLPNTPEPTARAFRPKMPPGGSKKRPSHPGSPGTTLRDIELPPKGFREVSRDISTNIQEAHDHEPRHGGGMGRRQYKS
eukprot:3281803-Pyramimonas_sp.AAC.1